MNKIIAPLIEFLYSKSTPCKLDEEPQVLRYNLVAK